MLCFSIVKNTKAIFNTKVPDGAINSINGIRTISITWVILGHLISQVIQSGSSEIKKHVFRITKDPFQIFKQFVELTTSS